MRGFVFTAFIATIGLLLSPLVPLEGNAQVKQKVQAAKQPRDTAQAQRTTVSWSPGVAAFVNLSEDDFRSIGLSRLSSEQYSAFAVWYFKYGRVNCPSFYDGHDKVRVNVSISADDPIREEVLSSLLDKLRAPGDLTITDSGPDSDAVISIAAMRATSKQGEPMNVFSAALTSYQPCKESNVTRDPDIYASFLGSLDLVTAGNTQALADELYVSINTEVLDQLRKQRDIAQDFLKASKKPNP